MKHEVKATWVDKMSFETELFGHKFFLDTGVEMGGDDKGPRPKPLMLTALAGCTGMDMLVILKKMRVKFDDFNVSVEGELTEDQPKRYNKMHVIYEFKGKDLSLEKIQKAVKLSEESYCGVSAVYRQAMEITSEVRILE